MGHGRCGGCSAALTQELKNAAPGEGGFIAHWIEMLDEAREKVVSQYGDDHNRDARRAMEQEGVKVSLANLRTFPCVREKERTGARSEEHTSELQSLMRHSYAVF